MTLKKVGESFSFLSSSHRVNPLKEFVSDCSSLWAPELFTACSLFSPFSLMPCIYKKQKKNKNRKVKQPHIHIVIPVQQDAFYLKEGTWISGSCKFKSSPCQQFPCCRLLRPHFNQSLPHFFLIRQTEHQTPVQVNPHILSKDSSMREEHWRSDWEQTHLPERKITSHMAVTSPVLIKWHNAFSKAKEQ